MFLRKEKKKCVTFGKSHLALLLNACHLCNILYFLISKAKIVKQGEVIPLKSHVVANIIKIPACGVRKRRIDSPF